MDLALAGELDEINAKFTSAIAALERALRGNGPHLAELGKHRIRFARVAGERLRFLTNRLIPELAVGPTPAHPAAARTVEGRVHALFAQSTRHIGRCGSPQVAADWPGYAAETRAMIADVRSYLATERREVHPLLSALPRVVSDIRRTSRDLGN